MFVVATNERDAGLLSDAQLLDAHKDQGVPLFFPEDSRVRFTRRAEEMKSDPWEAEVDSHWRSGQISVMAIRPFWCYHGEGLEIVS